MVRGVVSPLRASQQRPLGLGSCATGQEVLGRLGLLLHPCTPGLPAGSLQAMAARPWGSPATLPSLQQVRSRPHTVCSSRPHTVYSSRPHTVYSLSHLPLHPALPCPACPAASQVKREAMHPKSSQPGGIPSRAKDRRAPITFE
jgi:hypothetical protein